MEADMLNDVVCVRNGNGTVDLFVDGDYVHPEKSQRVWNHSPDGFNVGYGGSGPAQLALGILLFFFPSEVAIAEYQNMPEVKLTIDVILWVKIQVGAVFSNVNTDLILGFLRGLNPGDEQVLVYYHVMPETQLGGMFNLHKWCNRLNVGYNVLSITPHVAQGYSIHEVQLDGKVRNLVGYFETYNNP
jgi:hypothetical protein